MSSKDTKVRIVVKIYFSPIFHHLSIRGYKLTQATQHITSQTNIEHKAIQKIKVPEEEKLVELDEIETSIHPPVLFANFSSS